MNFQFILKVLKADHNESNVLMADHTCSNSNPQTEAPVLDRDNQRLDRFLDQLFSDSTCEYASFSFPIDAIDPLAYLEMCWKSDTYQYYWEKPDEEFAIAGGDALLTLTADGSERFEQINTQVEEVTEASAQFSTIPHPYGGIMFLGGFSFFDCMSDSVWGDFEPASFTLPRWMIIKNGKFSICTISITTTDFDNPTQVRQHLQQQLEHIEQTVATNVERNAQNDCFNSIRSASYKNDDQKEKWVQSVEAAKNYIADNKFEKIVLARQLTVPQKTAVPPTQVVNNLRQQYTGCYNFLIHQPAGKTFLGSTPERLGAFRKQLLLTEALAGSIQRGNTATEDTIFEKHLAGSKKDRDEHNFVIKDIEERLRPIAKTMDRKDRPDIKKLSNVQHLYTPIRAQLNEQTSMLDVIEQLHPTPAVGGYPWNNAAEHIEELEHFERGWYAGPVGWFNTDGHGEFAVGIRSGLFTDNEAHFFAGCGIVADSNPQTEWEETNLKLKPMLSALQYD